jgi:hypothetical protein
MTKNHELLPESLRYARASMSCEAQELLSYPRDLSDAAHEHADGHECVIYTYRAHKLCLDGCTSAELAEAEEEAEECGSMNGKGYHEMASVLAYFILRRRYEDSVREELQAYRDELLAWESEDSTQEEVDAITDEINAVEKVLG